MALALPVLSLSDPPQSVEGSIDPLSLQATYEKLAETIYPFITARMFRPRFLTAIALEAVVCDQLEEQLAADGTTPPWLVCEWLLVEGFVRRWEKAGHGTRRGIPGIQKVGRAVDAGRPVSGPAYLKTPRVFGLTGVYKTLAFGLRIVTDDIQIDDGGFELLRIWEREQELDGFLDGRVGAGARLRDQLRSAVEAGLRRGHTAVPSSWSAWEPIVRHLDPGTAGAQESKWLCERLKNTELRQNARDLDATAMRRELLDRLERDQPNIGASINANPRADEARFLRSLLAPNSGASGALRERLRMIDAYEGLCRVLEDGLALVRQLSTVRRSGPIDASDFAADDLGKAFSKRLEPASRRLAEVATGSPWEPILQRLIERYRDVTDPRGMFEALLEHHEEAQREKPPEGKRPWLERIGNNSVIVRPQYRVEERFDETDAYVRDYRSFTASSFLRDLRRLSK